MATHNEVAHNWANKTGRARKGYSMFYDDDIIYSWGYHFPIARHTKDAHGADVILLTSANYSVSTSKHKTITWRAMHHLRHFTVADVMPPRHEFNADVMAADFKSNLESSARRRKASYKIMDLESASRVAADHAAYCEAFNVDRAPLVMPDDIGEQLAQWRRDAAEQAERQRIEQEERAKQIRIDAEQDIINWKCGENVRLPYLGGLYFLRIVGDVVQTSGGVSIPIGDARRAFPYMCALHDKTEYRDDMVTPSHHIKLGNFKLDYVTREHVVAGCHRIEWSEIERIGAQL